MLSAGNALTEWVVSTQPSRKKFGRWYSSLFAERQFPKALFLWLLGMPFMLKDFTNPYDLGAHGKMAFIKSVYVTMPLVTLLPGVIELLWLPKEHYRRWWGAFKTTFVADCWNIFPAGLIMYLAHGDDGFGGLTRRDPELGLREAGELLLLLCSHEFWFYVTHRMNHTEFFYFTTHGHHHQNVGYVYMVNNSDVDIWELLSQGLFGLMFPLLFIKVHMFAHLAALGWFFTYTCTIHSSYLRPTNLHVVHHQHGIKATNFGLYTPLMDWLVGTYSGRLTGYQSGQVKRHN